MKKQKSKILKVGISFFLIIVALIALIFFKVQYEYYVLSPYDVIISDVGYNCAVISWKTDTRVPSYILLNDEYIGSGEYEKFHRIEIDNLKSQHEYTFFITDGKRTWSESIKKGRISLENLLAKEFKFITKDFNEEIYLPIEEVLTTYPNELTYVVLYDQETGKYSEVKSKYANKFGGIVFDKAGFINVNPLTSVLQNINYFGNSNAYSFLEEMFIPVYAAEGINCNQNIPDQKSNAISREAFSDLANRWVGNRGKNYAYECYNDVIYRAKRAGVDPAFVLTMWLKESSASNYTVNPRIADSVEDFGIHNKKDVPPRDFNSQINYFLTLRHKVQCPGLNSWEAWANNYRTGSCNTNNPARRQIGLDYLKDVERVYRWITNGKRLPKSVTGYTRIEPIYEELEPKCCALKLDNSDNFLGVFTDFTNGKNCEQLWPFSTTISNGKLQYSLLLQEKQNSVTCEREFEGVCCNLGNKMEWYPKEICTDIIEEVVDSKGCNEYSGQMACYFRNAKYMWLPIVLGNDYEDNITSSQSCSERNNVNSYEINLLKGVNFIGFDFYPLYHSRELMASELLEIYPEISIIANFKEQQWQDMIVRTESIPFAGEDFPFEQNRGYLIIAEDDLTMNLQGWIESTVDYEQVSEGWLLVGGNLYTKSEWASKLIADLQSKKIPAMTVAVWSSDTGYFYYRREDGKEIHGEDVELEDTKGIFIRGI
jgi:hypothetical protein